MKNYFSFQIKDKLYLVTASSFSQAEKEARQFRDENLFVLRETYSYFPSSLGKILNRYNRSLKTCIWFGKICASCHDHYPSATYCWMEQCWNCKQ